MSRRLKELCDGKNKFGLEVVKRLYITGKTQNWLADQCGVSKQYISQIVYVGQILSAQKMTDAARQELWRVAADTDYGGTRMFFKVWKLLQKLANAENSEITRDTVRQLMGKYLLTGR